MNHAQPAAIGDPHARRSDPRSSHRTVASLAADAKLRSRILAVVEAHRFNNVENDFDDTDLTLWLEEATGRRHQRNVVARERGLMEQAGEFICVGEITRPDRTTIHFRIARPGDQLRLFTGRVQRPSYRQLDSTNRWCTTHDWIVFNQAEICEHVHNDMYLDEQLDAAPCIITELYIKE